MDLSELYDLLPGLVITMSLSMAEIIGVALAFVAGFLLVKTALKWIFSML